MGKIRLLLSERKSIFDQRTLETIEHEEDMEIVGVSRNSKETLEMSKKYRPDILLIDGKNIDNEQIFERVTALNPCVKFIVVSDRNENDNEELFRSIESGAKGYISNEIPPEELLDNIKLVNEGGCVMDPAVVSVFLDKFRELDKTKKKVPCLSKVEKHMMELVIKGMSERDIARSMGISRRITRTFVRDILKKLSVENLTQAVIVVMKRRLVDG
jgi:DNA-binding NarL/FixJ family response regulator